MKTLKYILSTVLIIAAFFGCTEEEFGSVDFVSTATAPTNITALFNVTQDNTGVVTITPNSEGAINYDVFLGDETAEPINLKQGESYTHTYIEGTYDVKIIGYGITGLKAETVVPLTVSFKAPENLEVTITNDEAVSKQVNVTATADFAASFEVYFGEAENEEPVLANIGDTASYVYAEAGIYTIRVVALGSAIETTEYTVEFEAIAIVQPVNSAPTPPARNTVDVISIYGDAYATIDGTNYNPDWGQSGQGSSFAEFDLGGDKMLQYINLSYQGIALADGTSVDVSSMEFLHIDVWTADVTTLETSLINGVNGTSTEAPVSRDLTADSWTSIDIPISEYTSQGLTVDQIFQLKLVGTPWAGGTVFVDNIYFYVETPSAPIIAAESPTVPEALVTSIFSDAYTNVTVSEWNPDWGQSTTLTTVDIEGNNTLKYEALNYTGIVTDYANPTDVSNRTHVHFDYWTNDAESFAFKLVNTSYGDGDPLKESEVAVSSVAIGSWVSVNIPLADFTTDPSGITQMLFASSGATVYIDNLYFFTELADAPSSAATTPILNDADVVSIFSDAYTNVTVTEWNPDWGQSTTLTTVDIEGNSTLKYENLNYTGIVTDYGNPTDVSSKTFVHFDYWSNNATSLAFKIVNTSYGDGDPLKESEVTVPSITLGSWVGVDIPLADFTTDPSGITQMLFASSSAKVYIDNLYFY